jgi:predicted RNase H-like HicB family nuclease
MKRARYWVVVSKDPGSDWGAYVPDLPGCVATGRTLDVVLRRIRDGIQMHLKGLKEDRLPLPQPRSKIPINVRRSKRQVDFYATIEVAA